MSARILTNGITEESLRRELAAWHDGETPVPDATPYLLVGSETLGDDAYERIRYLHRDGRLPGGRSPRIIVVHGLASPLGPDYWMIADSMPWDES